LPKIDVGPDKKDLEVEVRKLIENAVGVKEVGHGERFT
jgi:hypothetical protein